MASPTSQAKGSGKYPKQVVIMVTPDVYEHLKHVAETHSVSMSEAARTYIDAGIEAGQAAAERRAEAERQANLAERLKAERRAAARAT